MKDASGDPTGPSGDREASGINLRQIAKKKFRDAASISSSRSAHSPLLRLRGRFTAGCSETHPALVVAQAGEIPVGGSKIFTYPDDVHRACFCGLPKMLTLLQPHLHTHVLSRFLPRRRKSDRCPCHGGVYSVADGSVLAGPPPRPLPRITLEQRGSDFVATGM